MDELEAIQLVSFGLVSRARREDKSKKGYDPEYVFRYIYRWYSQKYNTPLHEVYTLPTFDVLRAFYEDKYESMSDDDLENERLELIKTDEQREKEAREQAEEDIIGLEMAQEEEAKVDSPVTKLTNAVGMFQDTISKMKKGKEMDIETGIVDKTLPPDIKITFVTEEELDRELESDALGMLDPPKPR